MNERNALRAMDAALERVQAELSLRLTSLPDLSALLAAETHGAARRFFKCLDDLLYQLGERPFLSLWGEAVSVLKELRGEERETLLRLGEALGRYALPEQTAAVADCRARLKRKEEALSATMRDRQRLVYGLASAAGGLLCILLL